MDSTQQIKYISLLPGVTRVDQIDSKQLYKVQGNLIVTFLDSDGNLNKCRTDCIWFSYITPIAFKANPINEIWTTKDKFSVTTTKQMYSLPPHKTCISELKLVS